MLYPFVGVNLMKKGILYSGKVINYVESKMFFDLTMSDEKIENIVE